MSGKTDLEKDERQFMVKKTVGHFSLEQICDSGQCFRMEKLEKGEFLVLAGNREFPKVKDTTSIPR